MSDSCPALRGIPADSARELLSDDGVGKMLLSERRVGPENALSDFYDIVTGMGYDAKYCTELPGTVEKGDILFVLGHRGIEGFAAWAESLPAGVMVVCSQELCHQVSAVFRYR